MKKHKRGLAERLLSLLLTVVLTAGLLVTDSSMAVWGAGQEAEPTAKAAEKTSEADTPSPAESQTPAATAVPTNTPAATGTPAATPTATGTPAVTPTATGTPAATPTATGTPAATPTGTPSTTPKAAATPTGTPKATGTPAATGTPKATGTPAATPTGTPKAAATPTVTPKVTPNLQKRQSKAALLRAASITPAIKLENGFKYLTNGKTTTVTITGLGLGKKKIAVASDKDAAQKSYFVMRKADTSTAYADQFEISDFEGEELRIELMGQVAGTGKLTVVVTPEGQTPISPAVQAIKVQKPLDFEIKLVDGTDTELTNFSNIKTTTPLKVKVIPKDVNFSENITITGFGETKTVAKDQTENAYLFDVPYRKAGTYSVKAEYKYPDYTDLTIYDYSEAEKTEDFVLNSIQKDNSITAPTVEAASTQVKDELNTGSEYNGQDVSINLENLSTISGKELKAEIIDNANGNTAADPYISAAISGSTLTIKKLKAGDGQAVRIYYPEDDIYAASANLDIPVNVTKAQLSISDIVVKEKVYDGTTVAEIGSYTVSGDVAADNVKDNLDLTVSFTSENVKSSAYTEDDFTVSCKFKDAALDSKYELPDETALKTALDITDAKITPFELSLNNNSIQGKTLSGQTHSLNVTDNIDTIPTAAGVSADDFEKSVTITEGGDYAKVLSSNTGFTVEDLKSDSDTGNTVKIQYKLSHKTDKTNYKEFSKEETFTVKKRDLAFAIQVLTTDNKNGEQDIVAQGGNVVWDNIHTKTQLKVKVIPSSTVGYVNLPASGYPDNVELKIQKVGSKAADTATLAYVPAEQAYIYEGWTYHPRGNYSITASYTSAEPSAEFANSTKNVTADLTKLALLSLKSDIETEYEMLYTAQSLDIKPENALKNLKMAYSDEAFKEYFKAEVKDGVVTITPLKAGTGTINIWNPEKNEKGEDVTDAYVTGETNATSIKITVKPQTLALSAVKIAQRAYDKTTAVTLDDNAPFQMEDNLLKESDKQKSEAIKKEIKTILEQAIILASADAGVKDKTTDFSIDQSKLVFASTSDWNGKYALSLSADQILPVTITPYQLETDKISLEIGEQNLLVGYQTDITVNDSNMAGSNTVTVSVVDKDGNPVKVSETGADGSQVPNDLLTVGFDQSTNKGTVTANKTIDKDSVTAYIKVSLTAADANYTLGNGSGEITFTDKPITVKKRTLKVDSLTLSYTDSSNQPVILPEKDKDKVKDIKDINTTTALTVNAKVSYVPASSANVRDTFTEEEKTFSKDLKLTIEGANTDKKDNLSQETLTFDKNKKEFQYSWTKKRRRDNYKVTASYDGDGSCYEKTEEKTYNFNGIRMTKADIPELSDADKLTLQSLKYADLPLEFTAAQPASPAMDALKLQAAVCDANGVVKEEGSYLIVEVIDPDVEIFRIDAKRAKKDTEDSEYVKLWYEDTKYFSVNPAETGEDEAFSQAEVLIGKSPLTIGKIKVKDKEYDSTTAAEIYDAADGKDYQFVNAATELKASERIDETGKAATIKSLKESIDLSLSFASADAGVRVLEENTAYTDDFTITQDEPKFKATDGSEITWADKYTLQLDAQPIDYSVQPEILPRKVPIKIVYDEKPLSEQSILLSELDKDKLLTVIDDSFKPADYDTLDALKAKLPTVTIRGESKDTEILLADETVKEEAFEIKVYEEDGRIYTAESTSDFAEDEGKITSLICDAADASLKNYRFVYDKAYAENLTISRDPLAAENLSLAEIDGLYRDGTDIWFNDKKVESNNDLYELLLTPDSWRGTADKPFYSMVICKEGDSAYEKLDLAFLQRIAASESKEAAVTVYLSQDADDNVTGKNRTMGVEFTFHFDEMVPDASFDKIGTHGFQQFTSDGKFKFSLFDRQRISAKVIITDKGNCEHPSKLNMERCYYDIWYIKDDIKEGFLGGELKDSFTDNVGELNAENITKADIKGNFDWKQITGLKEGSAIDMNTLALDDDPQTGNYIVAVKCYDNAGNGTIYTSNGIVAEAFIPEVPAIRLSDSVYTYRFNDESTNLYNGDVTATVTVKDSYVEGSTDLASGIDKLYYYVGTTNELEKKAGVGSITELNDTKQHEKSNNLIGAKDLKLGSKKFETASKPAITSDETEKADENALTTGQTLTYLRTEQHTYSITVPSKTYEGNDLVLYVAAKDRAGNYSFNKVPFMIDVTHPTVSIEYTDGDKTAPTNGKYFNRNRTATITVTDKNVKNAADAKETYKFKLNGGYITLEELGKKIGKASSWSDSEAGKDPRTFTGDHKLTATITFSNDGTYQLTDVSCKDYGERGKGEQNLTDVHFNDQAAQFVVDKTKPVVKAAYLDADGKEIKFSKDKRVYKNKNIRLQIEIEELNFAAANNDFAVNDTGNNRSVGAVINTFEARDVNGTPLMDEKAYLASMQTAGKWSNSGIVHKQTLTFATDANYAFRFNYTDLAGNKASVSKRNFTVDKVAPVGSVQVEKETVSRNFLTNILWKYFYKKSISVHLTSQDNTSGAKIFYHNAYNRLGRQQMEGVSWTELAGYAATNAKSFGRNPQQQFVTYAKIVDKAGNTTYLSSDGGIVLDTTAPQPEITITTAKPAHDIYGGNVGIRINVTDPEAGRTHAGLKSVTYEVLNNNSVTQTQTFSFKASDRTQSFSHNFDIDSSKNNSNFVSVRVKVVDNAGNEAVKDLKDIKIDITKPTISVTWNDNAPANGKYYKNGRVATVTIKERNFDPNNVNFNITNTDGTQPSKSGWSHSANSGSSDDATHTCTVSFHADGDYTFTLNCTDLAGNKAEYGKTDTFTVDKTVPKMEVTYDNNSAENEKYYKEDRTATVKITEHNFSAADVKAAITASLEGKSIAAPAISSFSNAGDTHTATVKYSTDGDYTFDIDYTDLAGNKAADYSQDVFTVDKTAPELKISGVKKANKDTVTPVVSGKDVNHNPSGIALEMKGANHKQFDVSFNSNDSRTEFQITNFTRNTGQDMDDIYTLKASLKDLAGNVTEESITFSVNRFGSVYKMEDSTEKLLKSYYTNSPSDIKLTETNTDKLEHIKITCTKDGEVMELEKGEHYKVVESGAESGWKQYTYTIFKENFTADGKYVVTIYSKDGAENESTNQAKDKSIEFVVDTMSPDIILTGVSDNGRYRAVRQTVYVNVSDNILLKSLHVEVIPDGGEPIVYDYTPKELDDNGAAEIILQQMSGRQTIKASAEDMAGNVMEMKDIHVRVSANIFVLYKEWFIGGIIILLLLIALIAYIYNRKKQGKPVLPTAGNQQQ